jgi:hypothetical protein
MHKRREGTIVVDEWTFAGQHLPTSVPAVRRAVEAEVELNKTRTANSSPHDWSSATRDYPIAMNTTVDKCYAI